LAKKATNWIEELKTWRQQNSERYAQTLLKEPEKESLYSTLPTNGVILIMGDIGMGKSALAHEMANLMHVRKGRPAVIHIPKIDEHTTKKLTKLIPPWMKVVKSRGDWPINAVVIYDEAAQSAHARRGMSGDAVELDDLIGIARQRNQLIIFISHHSRKLDINVITEVKRIIWKKPTYAHQMFERDEVADFSMRAFQFFDKLRGAKKWTDSTLQRIKKLSLVLDMENFTFSQCTNGVPPWWTPDLSCIFSDIEHSQKKTVFRG
jgi:energy-coupling factor transporter ATP-binding protein EcfA2